MTNQTDTLTLETAIENMFAAMCDEIAEYALLTNLPVVFMTSTMFEVTVTITRDLGQWFFLLECGDEWFATIDAYEAVAAMVNAVRFVIGE